MTHIVLNQDLVKTLQDKVVVLTGGSTGIGRAAVELFHSKYSARSAATCLPRTLGYGAKVVFGDVNDQLGQELATQLGPSVQYVHCNAASYADQLALFASAEKSFGRIDVVCANAGVAVHADIFAPDADWQSEPSMIEIDVNTKGCLFSARIGMGYLRKNGGGDLVLTSSIAGWKECSHLVTYTASKHAVIGILRGLYQQAWTENITVNVICPWMTSKSIDLSQYFRWTYVNRNTYGHWYRSGMAETRASRKRSCGCCPSHGTLRNGEQRTRWRDPPWCGTAVHWQNTSYRWRSGL